MEPQNPSFDKLYVVRNCWSTDYRALNLWKGRSGCFLLPLMILTVQPSVFLLCYHRSISNALAYSSGILMAYSNPGEYIAIISQAPSRLKSKHAPRSSLPLTRRTLSQCWSFTIPCLRFWATKNSLISCYIIVKRPVGYVRFRLCINGAAAVMDSCLPCFSFPACLSCLFPYYQLTAEICYFSFYCCCCCCCCCCYCCCCCCYCCCSWYFSLHPEL